MNPVFADKLGTQEGYDSKGRLVRVATAPGSLPRTTDKPAPATTVSVPEAAPQRESRSGGHGKRADAPAGAEAQARRSACYRASDDNYWPDWQSVWRFKGRGVDSDGIGRPGTGPGAKRQYRSGCKAETCSACAGDDTSADAYGFNTIGAETARYSAARARKYQPSGVETACAANSESGSAARPGAGNSRRLCHAARQQQRLADRCTAGCPAGSFNSFR